MAICTNTSRPLGFSIHSANQHESKCVEDVLESIPPINLPVRIYGDKAYDSDYLQQMIAENWGIELNAPVRKNNKQRIDAPSQQDQKERKNRWKIERFFSWLKGFRRINIRWEYHPENFLAWIFLAASIIVFSRF